jgi:choline dehydrogenase-like flavoprotein
MTASTGAMVRDVGEGQISASRGAGDKVRYDIHPEDVARARRGMERAAQLWLEGLGADFVTLNLYGARLCRTMDEVRADLPADLHPNRLIGYSSHPQASCRLGRATDDAGEVRGVAGVHVADASALPCNVGRNPQVSVMTTARLLSERVARRMGKEPSPLWAGPGPLPAPIFQAGPCGLRATDGGAGGPAAGAEASP